MTAARRDPGSGQCMPADGSTSRSLLEAAKQEHPAAWSRLMDLYSPLVAAWCGRWGVAHQDVADIEQEVFAAVARNLERFRKERAGDTFRGWLTTITRNKVRDYFRRRGDEPAGAGGTEAWLRISQVSDGQHSPTETNEQDGEIFSDILRRALASIRGEFQERTWQAFWQTVIEGKATSDVALELEMQPGAVRVCKSRILCRLRSELGEEPQPQAWVTNPSDSSK